MIETRKKISELLDLTWAIEFKELSLSYAKQRLDMFRGSKSEGAIKYEVDSLQADITDMKAQFNRIKKEL